MLNRSSMFIRLALQKCTASSSHVQVMRISSKAAGLIRADFVDMKIDSQNYVVRPFTGLPYTGDLSGYTDEPRGKFAGQEQTFIKYGVRQLNSQASVWLLRGDARPLDFILEKGIIPLAPRGELDLVRHRKGWNDSSSGVSFTSSLQIALSSGSYSSTMPRYGRWPTIGSNNFTVLVVKLDGKQYDVAGPSSSPGKLFDYEQESTVAGTVSPRNIVGYRNCVSQDITVAALGIFTRADLPPEEQESITQLLCRHR